MSRSRVYEGRRRKRALAMLALVAAGAVVLAACGSSGKTAASAPLSSAGSTGSAGGSTAAAATGTPIKIGTVGQYSGVAGDTSKATADSVVAWSKAVNAKGGINGHPIQVIVKDDQDNAALSVASVKELISVDHVVALVGNHESGLDATWASYADAQKVPVVGGVATGAAYSTDPNFFPIGSTGVSGSANYVLAAKDFGKTSYSLVYCAEFPACAQAEGLAVYYTKVLGVTNVPGLSISASATSYTAQCTKLKQAGAQAVFTASSLDVSARFVGECKTQGYTPLAIDNPQNWKDSATKDPVWEGAVLASDAPLWFGTGNGTAEYLAAMKQYEPSSILNASGTNGWYSGKLFEAILDAAFKAGATGDVTSQTVYDGLYALGPNFDLGGIVAPVTYTKGKPATQQICSWFAQVKNGALTAPKGYAPICDPSIKPPSLG
jgi:branched-chain amino acid transport system substrate-binding protein